MINMAYAFINKDINPKIRYIGTGAKPASSDVGAILLDSSNSSYWIWDGTTWIAYLDPKLTT
jgi:hypothetical protein